MNVETLIWAFFAAALDVFFAVPENLIEPKGDVLEQLNALNRDDFPAYAAFFGMNLTMYDVVTPDGWVLQIWRVRSMDIYDEKLSTPIIVSHASGSSAFDYMWNLRNQSTAWILADWGFDVWITNYRANQFSNKIMEKNGTTRPPNTREYIKATWQFMAEFDLPTVIDYVLEKTGQPKAYLIGHSQGTTAAFAYCSENHIYDEKILHFSAIVPVLKFGEDTSIFFQIFFRGIALFVDLLEGVLSDRILGTQLIAADDGPGYGQPSQVLGLVCGIFAPLCGRILGLLDNTKFSQGLMKDVHLNKTRTPIFFSKTPGGLTLLNEYNYGMEFDKNPWTKIDWDRLSLTNFSNMEEYNQTSPPEYHFENCGFPFSLIIAENDVFAGNSTATKVVEMLNTTDYVSVDGKGLNHLDAVVGFDSRCYTTDKVLLRFDGIERKRDEAHKAYRVRVAAHLKSLRYEEGCPSPQR